MPIKQNVLEFFSFEASTGTNRIKARTILSTGKSQYNKIKSLGICVYRPEYLQRGNFQFFGRFYSENCISHEKNPPRISSDNLSETIFRETA